MRASKSIGSISDTQTHLLGTSIILASDLLAICCASSVADYLYQSLIWQVPSNLSNALTYGLCVGLIYFLTSCFDRLSLRSLVNIPVRLIAWRFGVSLSIFLSILFLLKIGNVFSRGQFVVFAVIGLAFLFGNRRLFAIALKSGLVRVAFKPQRLAVIGDISEMQRTRRELSLEPSHYRLVEALEVSNAGVPEAVKQAVRLSRNGAIDAILVALPWSEWKSIDEIVTQLNQQALPVLLMPDANSSLFISRPTTALSRLPAYVIRESSLNPFERALKRSFDTIFAAALMILLSPIFIAAALAIKLDSGGPIFYRQRRTGFNHTEFRIFKFRTMSTCDDDNNVRQATRDDPRLTRVGAFLRRTSIDELPQLLNVLRGEMSIVGPRPHAVSHDNEWTKTVDSYAARYNVKPGMTGLAQVLGFRGETETVCKLAERVNCDLKYIENWSFWLDLRIIARTIRVFAFQQSAY
jgi:Undecaprenyl-phosphate glucose phosphotransferase